MMIMIIMVIMIIMIIIKWINIIMKKYKANNLTRYIFKTRINLKKNKY